MCKLFKDKPNKLLKLQKGRKTFALKLKKKANSLISDLFTFSTKCVTFQHSSDFSQHKNNLENIFKFSFIG